MKKISSFLTLIKIYFSYILKVKKCNYLPVRLWIETSSRCNLACRLCVNKDISKEFKGDMDFNLYKKIIDEARGSVLDVNLFHRGEPLLNTSMIKMIEYANSKNIKTRIHTNGVLLNKYLSMELVKSGLDLISFSFDGYTRETYEKNRIGAGFEKTLNNIIEFLKIKKETGSKKPFTIVQVMEFDEELSKETFEKQKKNFIKNFENLPLDKLVIRTPHNWGGLLGIEGVRKINKSRDKLIPCTFPWYSLTIFYDGKAYLCPQDFGGEIPLGDLNKESLSDIFNNKIISEIREKFRTKNVSDLNPCSSCDRIWRETVAGIPKEYLKSFIGDYTRRD
ncbi:MAG: radical SAM protein [Actinobacteria bacterium]|nr:radical SAM protein [Actinomycetota bacterium]